MKRKSMFKELDISNRIERGECDIHKGRAVVADTKMSFKNVDSLLMGNY